MILIYFYLLMNFMISSSSSMLFSALCFILASFFCRLHLQLETLNRLRFDKRSIKPYSVLSDAKCELSFLNICITRLAVNPSPKR